MRLARSRLRLTAAARFIQLESACQVEILASSAAAGLKTEPVIVGDEEAEVRRQRCARLAELAVHRQDDRLGRLSLLLVAAVLPARASSAALATLTLQDAAKQKAKGL